ncbi:MAG: phosphoribosylformylglycinamidine synthase subunit PurL [Candidatus Eisenbacteria sp.]|nr:phosphoribosylformylglycinamidine synthase subunit PurL [Candidatus Eisenbacteria bacterium]
MPAPTDVEQAVGLLLDLDLGFSPNEAMRLLKKLGRQPTLAEATLFSIMWSEHCSYKSSRSTLKALPTDGEHVVLGPGEDAGVVRIGEWGGRSWCLVMAHESHNHPSQIVPAEGAATGIGGIVRDVYCMGADVVGVMDALRFGNPDGERGVAAREIVTGVVDGIWQYGNALGVPNLGGDVAFDDSFNENCLVNVIALGLVAEDAVVRSRVPGEAAAEPYDVILVGKPTDSSGFGGATMASRALEDDEEVEQDRGAVQVPDPFLKRMLTLASARVLALAREREVPVGWKDLGAGGIACATSEMAAASGFGMQIDLALVPVAEGDLGPEVVVCSETQERYCWVVPRWFTPEVLKIYNDDFELPHIYHNARAAVIGKVTKSRRYQVDMEGERVCDMPVELITEPVREERNIAPWPAPPAQPQLPPMADLNVALTEVLASFDQCSREFVYRHYDTEVKGCAVVRSGEADAGVIAPLPGESLGLAFSVDGNPRYGRLDPYWAGALAVAEAMRNVAAVGATPWSLTDCLNYGSPEDPETFGAFAEGVRGISDAARRLWRKGSDREPVPIISGNVSFYNHSTSGKAVAPSPIVCCAGVLQDYSRCLTPRLKRAGSIIYLLGPRYGEMGGSEYMRILTGVWWAAVPQVRFEEERVRIHAAIELAGDGLLLSCHDISSGGMLVSAAEMMLANDPGQVLGMELEVGDLGAATRADLWLFCESPGFLMEVDCALAGEVEARLAGMGVRPERVGAVTHGDRLVVRHLGSAAIDLGYTDLKSGWSSAVAGAFVG